MSMKEAGAPKVNETNISAQEADKLNALSETVRGERAESTTAAANQKLSQRLNGQRETEPQIHADGEVNSGGQGEYGMMLCSDRCIKSRVHSGRCFHS